MRLHGERNREERKIRTVHRIANKFVADICGVGGQRESYVKNETHYIGQWTLFIRQDVIENLKRYGLLKGTGFISNSKSLIKIIQLICFVASSRFLLFLVGGMIVIKWQGAMCFPASISEQSHISQVNASVCTVMCNRRRLNDCRR